jgi:hypothetical protein
VGAAEAVALAVRDVLRTGTVQQDWWAVVGPAFQAMVVPPYGTAVAATPPANPAPPAPFTAYVATYANDFFGAIDVGTQSGTLVLRLGAHQRAFPLRHWDRDVFVYQPVGEYAYGPSAVTFTLGADGRAASVTIENLTLDQANGTFLRARRRRSGPRPGSRPAPGCNSGRSRRSRRSTGRSVWPAPQRAQ